MSSRSIGVGWRSLGVALGLVFVVAGALKLLSPPSAEVGTVPSVLAWLGDPLSDRLLTILVASAEIILGALLAIGWRLGAIAWVAAIVTLGFCAIHLTHVLLGKTQATCGCLGSTARVHEYSLLAVSGLMLMASLVLTRIEVADE